MRKFILIAALTGALLSGGTVAMTAIGSQGADDPAGTTSAATTRTTTTSPTQSTPTTTTETVHRHRGRGSDDAAGTDDRRGRGRGTDDGPNHT
jgi:hypothetical protein